MHHLRSLYNYFDTHEAQHHDTIFNHCIDMLPCINMHRRSLLCTYTVYAHARACVLYVCVWIHLCIYTHKLIQVSYVEYVCQDTLHEWYF